MREAALPRGAPYLFLSFARRGCCSLVGSEGKRGFFDFGLTASAGCGSIGCRRAGRGFSRRSSCWISGAGGCSGTSSCSTGLSGAGSSWCRCCGLGMLSGCCRGTAGGLAFTSSITGNGAMSGSSLTTSRGPSSGMSLSSMDVSSSGSHWMSSRWSSPGNERSSFIPGG